jgi:glycerophosphoryl diester phosphodiesterase
LGAKNPNFQNRQTGAHLGCLRTLQWQRVKNSALLLGHRGARLQSVRENTVEAFDHALDKGCDGFEFDLRHTADGHAIVCHDPKWRGLTVARRSRAQLPHLPVLEDVLAGFQNRAFLDIELKVPGLEHQVSLALRKYPPQRGYVVSSFRRQVLAEFRAVDPAAPLGIIFDKPTAKWQELAIQYVMPHRSLISPALIRQAHAAGQQVVVWTVNDRASLVRFASWGVDGIISDKPELLVTTLRPAATKTYLP